MIIAIYTFICVQLTRPQDEDNPFDMYFYALLNWMLAPLEATWLSATWLTRFHLWIATPLFLRLIEGAWWTFFFWLAHLILVPLLFLLYLSNLQLKYPTAQQDVRFWIPISLSVDLQVGGMSCFTKRRHCQRDTSRSRLSRSGFQVRVRWKDVSRA